MPNAKDIGQKIRNLRLGKGLTQAELAKVIGSSTSAVAMYETGERIPRDETKKKIADLFGLKIDELFFEPIDHNS